MIKKKYILEKYKISPNSFLGKKRDLTHAELLNRDYYKEDSQRI